jgi:hypothetical protein
MKLFTLLGNALRIKTAPPAPRRPDTVQAPEPSTTDAASAEATPSAPPAGTH